MTLPWNLTASGRRARSADVLVMSVGKSGRTWLRVLINKYLSLHFGVPFSLEDLHGQDAAIPSILYTHELWEYVSKATFRTKLLGKYLVPPRVLASKRVLLVYRDPRDVVVSLYFQKTRRSHARLGSTLPAFVRDPRFGIRSIVRVMNAWHSRLEGHSRCVRVGYEDLQADTAAELTRCLGLMGIAPARPELVAAAVDFSRFDNMKKMEAAGAFASKILRPGDPSDPQSFKVREGKIGGYRRHFDEPELQFLEEAVATLHPSFGYGEGMGRARV